jgi:hypothetical protein
VYVYNKHHSHQHAEQPADKRVTAPRKQATVPSRTNGSRVSGVNPNRNRDQSLVRNTRARTDYQRPKTAVRPSTQTSSRMQYESRVGPSTTRTQQVTKAQPRSQSGSRISSGRTDHGKRTDYSNTSRNSSIRN